MRYCIIGIDPHTIYSIFQKDFAALNTLMISACRTSILFAMHSRTIDRCTSSLYCFPTKLSTLLSQHFFDCLIDILWHIFELFSKNSQISVN